MKPLTRFLAIAVKKTGSNNPGECSAAEINLTDVEAESAGNQEQPLADKRHAGIIAHQLHGFQTGKGETFAQPNIQMDRPVSDDEVRLKKRRLHTMMSATVVRRLPGEDEVSEEHSDDKSDTLPDNASEISDSSENGGQQSSLMEILNYCQIMYSAIRRLDKKVEVMQKKVSDLHQGKMKFFAKKRQVLASLSNGYNQTLKKKTIVKSSEKKRNQRICSDSVAYRDPAECSEPIVIQDEEDATGTIVKKRPNASVPFHSMEQIRENLMPVTSSAVSGLVPQLPTLKTEPANLSQKLETMSATHKMNRSRVSLSESPHDFAEMGTSRTTQIEENGYITGLATDFINETNAMKQEQMTPHASFDLSKNSFGFLGNPKRNVRIPGAFILKASQKSQPKLAARYLVRNLFTDEILVESSVIGSEEQGLIPLDPNKLAAVREFLSKQFPHHDLTELGKDWKSCISAINSMISITRRRTNTGSYQDREYLSDEETSAPVLSPSTSEPSVNGQLWWLYQNSTPLPSAPNQRPFEKLEHLGSPDRKVELPASVIHLAQQRVRPELAARFLIRHLFPDSVLLRSNVYGAIRKGKAPLDCNKINAVREFLMDGFPSFDLAEDGKDWKVCVDAINGVIRCLRYELKKTSQGRSFLKHYSSPFKAQK
uniref:BEN domain-containing protein n=1 Tax=Callorhinchus milii TaxID=7868 RepID=A0A4W3I020_CALMI